MAKYITTDAELTSIANVIRAKTNSSDSISYPEGFATKIQSIATVGTDTTDANATAEDIVSPKTAYVNGYKITGSIQEKDATDVTVSTNTVSIPAGCYKGAVSKTVGTARNSDSVSISTNTVSIPAGFYSSDVSKTVGTARNSDSVSISTNTVSIPAGFYSSAVSKTVGTVKGSNDVSVSTNTVSIPAGFYSSAVSKTIAVGSASVSNTIITSSPTISVNTSTGVVTASNSKTQNISPTISAGYISSGSAGTITVNGANTYSLPTITGNTYTVYANAGRRFYAGNYLLSDIYIKGLSSSMSTSTHTVYLGTRLYVPGSNSGEIVTASLTVSLPNGNYAVGIQSYSATFAAASYLKCGRLTGFTNYVSTSNNVKSCVPTVSIEIINTVTGRQYVETTDPFVITFKIVPGSVV